MAKKKRFPNPLRSTLQTQVPPQGPTPVAPHQVSAYEAAEVLRRLSKLRDSSLSAESSMSLQNVEKRLKDHKSALVALGTEATSAMLSFEEQQQHITLQSLSTMSDIN
ncbi:hypothetical protein P8452_75319 [Trifolium repens]|nr:hypothetical protein P8452_75319 [Trifolium repens]